MKRLIAGTRGSKLALVQTNWVAGELDCEVEIRKISTRGDKIQDVALAQVEGKAFFTKEIDDALMAGEVDFAVHSFKDVPTELPEGMIVAAIPQRESVRDTLVGPYKGLEALPGNAKVGTCSLRRKALVLKERPDVQVMDLRGNIDTRVRKQAEGIYDTIVVAEAGLKRFGFGPEVEYHPLDPLAFIPAPGQGALAITARADDRETLALLAKLEHGPTRTACECEREFLTALEGGCQVPAGVYTQLGTDGTIRMTGFVSSVDGKLFIRSHREGPVEDAKALSRDLAEEILLSGGREILKAIRGSEVK